MDVTMENIFESRRPPVHTEDETERSVEMDGERTGNVRRPNFCPDLFSGGHRCPHPCFYL